jgi:uncharacterized protein (DUF58 family)
MQYGSGESMSKFDYACHIVASLSYLILEQQDAAGLYLFDKEVRQDLPPSSNPSYLKDIVHALSQAAPEEKSHMGLVFRELCQRLRKRGLVVILSDFFDEVPEILVGLRHLHQRKHDMIVFHILDNDEVSLPLQRLTLFEGLEDMDLRILADPRALRKAYLEEVQTFLREIKRGCMANHIDYVQITTNQLLDQALTAYLARRATRTRG